MKDVTSKIYKYKNILKYIFLFLLGICFIFLLIYNFKLIAFPYQNEYREGSTQIIVDALIKKINPFAVENQPKYNYAYGLAYPATVASLYTFFGESLQLSRIVSFIFIMLCLYIMYKVLRKDKAPLIYIIPAVLIFYDALLRDGYNMLARPDALGLFLFFAGVLIPYYFNFSRRSLIVSIFCTFLAFYTKPYFVAIIGYIAVYVFLFISKKKAVLYAVGTAALFLPWSILVHIFYPMYFNNVFTINFKNTPNDVEYMIEQLKDFFVYHLPIFVIGLLTALFLIYINWKHKNKYIKEVKKYINKNILIELVDIKNIKKGLIKIKFDFYLFCFACSTAIIIFKLGRHTGSYMTYLFQLMTPFMLLFGVKFLTEYLNNRTIKTLCIILIALNILLITKFYIDNTNLDSKVSSWKLTSELVSNNKDIFNSPAIVSLLIDQNKNVYETGQLEFFYAGNKDNAKYNQLNDNYIASINERIKSQSIDILILPFQYKFNIVNQNLIKQYYKYQKATTVEMPYTRQVWPLEIWVKK